MKASELYSGLLVVSLAINVALGFYLFASTYTSRGADRVSSRGVVTNGLALDLRRGEPLGRLRPVQDVFETATEVPWKVARDITPNINLLKANSIPTISALLKLTRSEAIQVQSQLETLSSVLQNRERDLVSARAENGRTILEFPSYSSEAEKQAFTTNLIEVLGLSRASILGELVELDPTLLTEGVERTLSIDESGKADLTTFRAGGKRHVQSANADFLVRRFGKLLALDSPE